MSELKLPDVSDEDKQAIADIEASLKKVYEDEATMTLENARALKKELNEQHRAAVAKGFENRMKVINADPDLKALHAKLSQGGEVSGGSE